MRSKRVWKRAMKIAVVAVVALLATGCITQEYVLDTPAGVDGDVNRDYEILGYVTTELVQREQISTSALEEASAEFGFDGFRRNLIEVARTQYDDVDDVIRVVVTPTQLRTTTNYIWFGAIDYIGRFHAEGVAIRYID
ncbi:MAG: hypothetical protein WD492_14235 [Alkalispirochaeta sp.]